MTVDFEAVLSRYAAELPAFKAACTWTRDRLRRVLRAHGIPSRVDARTKDPDSLVKKLIRREKAYEEVTDKAGVRVILRYPDDAPAVYELVAKHFLVVERDDKADKLPPDRFSYRATHFLVQHKRDNSETICEIQVHRPGEALSASLSHDLTYKAPPGLSKQAERSICRLAALTELIDLEAERVRRDLAQSEGAGEAALLMKLERPFFRLTGSNYDEQLSLILLGELLNVLPGPVDETTFEAVEKFCTEKHAKLRSIFERKADPIRYPFLVQPEALFVFFLLEQDEFRVEEKWPPRLPTSELTKFRNLWGMFG